jgi:Transport and Golgi organisation 2
MCTVTFLPRQRGYALAMNRDEKLTRITGLPPAEKIIQGRKMLSPSEPGGGTWIALNDFGATFALINWYLITARVKGEMVSRGRVVSAVGVLDSPGSASLILETLPLKRINPFRLIGFFPAAGEIAEWRWDLKKLVCKNHHWRVRQWISSGFDEPAAQRMRSETFRRAMKQKSAGSLDWLRRLHRSHLPQSGPFSTCLHRADAATVSCTEVTVSPDQAVMRHHAGAPCQCSAVSVHHLRLKR